MMLTVILLLWLMLTVVHTIQLEKLKAENKRLKEYMCKLGIAEQVVIRVCKARGETE